jgi:murein DD-endopeptidase MepM/ murein hydrolase activator NlpD
MRSYVTRNALPALILLGAHTVAAQTPAAPPRRELAFDVPIHVEFPVQPQIVRGDDGRRYIAYHALITNLSSVELILDRLDVVDPDRGTTLVSYDTTALRRQSIYQVALPDPPKRETVRHLPSGRLAVLRTWITLDSAQPAPARLVHRLTFAPTPALRVARSQSDTDGVLAISLPPLRIDPRPPTIISPPLRGGPWRASGGPGPAAYHLYFGSVDGRGRIAERFAIDYQKVDSAGQILPNPFPDKITNAMFYSNRADVYAVADGVIALVRDGFPENVPTPSGDENMPIPLTRESGAGNQLSIRIKDSVYAQYAHLAPGSIRVRLGDRVRRGQVIGQVGNAGNSKNPHLHFELADGPEINGSQGLPWVFDSFELWGHQVRGVMPDIKAPPTRHKNEMLLLDAIVRF